MNSLNLNPPPAPQPVPGATVTLTQAQWNDLMGRIAEAEQAAQPKAPPAWWTSFTGWVKSKHWSFHTLLLVYPTVAGVIVGNPQAHAAFLDLWAHTPHWLVDVVAIGGPVVALLVTGNKGTPPPA